MKRKYLFKDQASYSSRLELGVILLHIKTILPHVKDIAKFTGITPRTLYNHYNKAVKEKHE